MLASRIAEPIMRLEITIPQPTVVTKRRRNALDTNHSRESRGALLVEFCVQDVHLVRPIGGGSSQPRFVVEKSNTSTLGTLASVEQRSQSPRS